MALYDDAKIIFLASGAAGKETDDASKAYSVKPTNGNADFTISRTDNLNQTRVGPTGLIEKGRENLIKYSNGFDTGTGSGGWAKTNTSVTSGQGGYDGSTDAYKLQATATGSSTNSLSQTVTLTNLVTVSVFAKAGSNVSGTQILRLSLNEFLTSDSSQKDNSRAFFDLSDGSVASTGGNIIDTNSESFGGGWFRLSITANIPSTNTVDKAIIFMGNGGTTIDDQTNGDFFFIQDFQAEAGLVATDVITTTSAAATAGLKEDEPRFDYPVAGGAPSLLIEPLRKNEVPNSEGIVETSHDVTLTKNYGIAPDGTKSSLKVAKDGDDGNDRIFPISNDNVTLTNSGAYSISAFVKNIDCTGITTIACRTDAGSNELFRQGFQWTGASLALTSSQESGTRSGAFVESYGNDWWRIGFTFTANSTAGNFELDVDRANGTATTSIETWGWQLEEGANATSYIPCHGIAATRSADTLPEVTHGITMGTSITLFLEAIVFAVGHQISLVQLRLNDANRLLIFVNELKATATTHDISIQAKNSDANYVGNADPTAQSKQKTGLTTGATFKCIARIDGSSNSNNFDLFVNGSKHGTAKDVDAKDIFQKISLIRNGTATNQTGQKTKSVIVWNSALTDQQCEDLTTL